MKPGDRLVIYETADRKSAVGTGSVVSVDAGALKKTEVKITAGKSRPEKRSRNPFPWRKSKPICFSAIRRWFVKEDFPSCPSPLSSTDS
jgi:hypothetical protein